MPNEKLLELITATGEMLDLEGSVIEKDYYVTPSHSCACRGGKRLFSIDILWWNMFGKSS